MVPYRISLRFRKAALTGPRPLSWAQADLAWLDGEQLSSESRLQQVIDYAVLQGVPLVLRSEAEHDADDSAFVQALLAWSEFQAAASWRGEAGFVRLVRALGSFLGAASAARLHAWLGQLRSRAPLLTVRGAGTTFAEVLCELEDALAAATNLKGTAVSAGGAQRAPCGPAAPHVVAAAATPEPHPTAAASAVHAEAEWAPATYEEFLLGPPGTEAAVRRTPHAAHARPLNRRSDCVCTCVPFQAALQQYAPAMLSPHHTAAGVRAYTRAASARGNFALVKHFS